MRRYIFLFLMMLLGVFVCAGTYINGVEILNTLSITETTSGTTIVPVGGPVTIGDAGSSSHSLTANDDLFVSGKLEVDGAVHFDSAVIAYSNLSYTNNSGMNMGSSAFSSLMFDTGQTVATTQWGLDNTSRSLLIMERADMALDMGHAGQTNPTIFCHSSDATDTTQWISIAHDQTNGVIDVGKGKLTTPDAFQAADLYSGDGTQGATDSTSFWLCTAADCATKCQVVIKDGLITSCS